MFYRTADGVVGVLCDWDLSESADHIGEETPLAMDGDAYRSVEMLSGVIKLPKDVKFPFAPANIHAAPVDHEHEDEDEETHKCKVRFRTGTGPFMAMELLNEGKAPTHLYRYDLESFFWVLVYFVAVHNPEKHILGRVDQWADTSLEVVCGRKIEFLMNEKVSIGVMSKMHSRYMSFHATTLQRLGNLFSNLCSDNFSFRAQRRQYLAARVNRNMREAKNRAAEMIALCKKRNDMISYNALMECLE